MLGGRKKINGGHFIGQNVGIGANVINFFLKTVCHTNMGIVRKVADTNCLQKLEKEFGQKMSRLGGSVKRLREKNGRPFCGLCPAQTVQVTIKFVKPKRCGQIYRNF